MWMKKAALVAASVASLGAGSFGSLAADNSTYLSYLTVVDHQVGVKCVEYGEANDLNHLTVHARSNFGTLAVGQTGVELKIGDPSTSRTTESGQLEMDTWSGWWNGGASGVLIGLPREDFGCPAPPQSFRVLLGEVFAVFEAVDATVEICRRDAAGCNDAAFAVVDITRDGRLSRAEISRALRVAGFFGPTIASFGKPEIPTFSDSMSSLSFAGMVAPTIAQGLIAGSDYDGDGQLGLNEILQDRGEIDVGSLVIVLRTGLTEQLGRSLPGLFGALLKTMTGF